jgi:phosphonate transport system permease protein
VSLLDTPPVAPGDARSGVRLDTVADSEHRSRRAPPRSSTTRRRLWLAFFALLGTWAFIDALARSGALFNPGGWSLVGRFASAALHPDLSGDFVAVVASAAIVTVGYAVLGTTFALVVGGIGGVLSSEAWWTRDPLDDVGRSPVRPLWWMVRTFAVVPRGLHEAIWALILLSVLGRDPLVGVLAIGIPFGAVTAKVVAEMIDDTADDSFIALRRAGAGRTTALCFGVVPTISGALVAYGYYRFECAMRSSVVLGMIGAAGLGFQLTLSFQSLRYEEIWTIVYTIVLLAVVTDVWCAAVRRRARPGVLPATAIGGLVLAVVSWQRLELDLTTLVDERTRALVGDLADSAWPPRLPSGGWGELFANSVETVQLSVIAISFATVLAVPFAFACARRDGDSIGHRFARFVIRVVLVVVRSIPPPIWALVLLFVMFPGPLPGGLALGVYTFGVLCRLNADALEATDRAVSGSLSAAGAPTTSARLYGEVPLVAPRFAALSMYRWEVAMRETVIVGLVGAGGLGRVLAQQNAAFDRAGMLTTLTALVILAFLADVISSRARSSLR